MIALVSHLVWDYNICLILNENKDNSVHSGKKTVGCGQMNSTLMYQGTAEI